MTIGLNFWSQPLTGHLKHNPPIKTCYPRGMQNSWRELSSKPRDVYGKRHPSHLTHLTNCNPRPRRHGDGRPAAVVSESG